VCAPAPSSSFPAQSRLRREPPHAIVATPALAASLVASGHVSLSSLRLLVLDEADELLSPAAAPATRALLAAAGAAAARAGASSSGGGEPAPPLRRVWVSATVTPAVVAAAAEAAAHARAPHPPVLLSDASAAAAGVPSATSAVPLPPPPAMSSALSHWRLDVGTSAAPPPTAVAVTATAAADADIDAAADAAAAAAAAAVARLHAALTPEGPILVFAPSGAAAPALLAALRGRAFRAAALTATQPAERRERAAVLRGVRAGRTQVLVTTEMGARGMDLPAVALVVNAGAPASHGAYLHRAGRAGRSAPGCVTPTPVRFALCVLACSASACVLFISCVC
jgi:superfamily II DNA/RNA helicase